MGRFQKRVIFFETFLFLKEAFKKFQPTLKRFQGSEKAYKRKAGVRRFSNKSSTDSVGVFKEARKLIQEKPAFAVFLLKGGSI